MRHFLIAALSATAIFGSAAITASAQETTTGAPRGTAPVTVEGHGPSSVVVCDQSGACWHSQEAYDYPQGAGVVVHSHDWRWNDGDHFAWKEHSGRGYWHGSDWQQF